MPASYKLDWSSPYKLLVSTIGAAAADKVHATGHSNGHALLKVRCGDDVPLYISQTGAIDDDKVQRATLAGKVPTIVLDPRDGEGRPKGIERGFENAETTPFK